MIRKYYKETLSSNYIKRDIIEKKKIKKVIQTYEFNPMNHKNIKIQINCQKLFQNFTIIFKRYFNIFDKCTLNRFNL